MPSVSRILCASLLPLAAKAFKVRLVFWVTGLVRVTLASIFWLLSPIVRVLSPCAVIYTWFLPEYWLLLSSLEQLIILSAVSATVHKLLMNFGVMDKKVALKLHKPLFYLPLQAFENMNKKFAITAVVK